MLLITLLLALGIQVAGQCEPARSYREKLRSLIKRWCWEIGRVRSILMKSSRCSLCKQIICTLLSWTWMNFIATRAQETALMFLILSLELAFTFTQMTIFSIFPFSVQYSNQILYMTLIYTSNTLLVALPIVLSKLNYESENKLLVFGKPLIVPEVLYCITFIHLVVLILIIKSRIQQKKHFVILNQVDKCVHVDLVGSEEEISNNSEIDGGSSKSANQNTSQYYIIQSKQKFQLISVSKSDLNKRTAGQSQIFGKIVPQKNVSIRSNQEKNQLPHSSSEQQQGIIQTQPQLCLSSPSEHKEIPNSPQAEMIQSIRNKRQSTKDTFFGGFKSANDIQIFGNESSNFVVEVLSEIELKEQSEENAVLMSYDQISKRMIVSTEKSIIFFEVPSFKKIKIILLDAKSSYIMHNSRPICVQYHTEDYLQFAKLDLTIPKLSPSDLKFKSIAFQNPSPANGFLFFGSFSQNEGSEFVDILFMRDGQNLVAVSFNEASTIETYTNRFPTDYKIPVSIEQLNCRQIVLNAGVFGSTSALKKVVLDIPTNLSCRVLTQLPVATEVKSIKNLQNQIILNIPNSSLSSCVYDLDTQEIMELPQSIRVIQAWFIQQHLFVIDQTKSVKVFSFKNTKFNLVPAGENGLCCVSLGSI